MGSSTFRDELIHQLGHEGFEIIIALDGTQALNKVRKHSIDAVVTQLNLPQMDGLELILNLRDLQIWIPVIVISFEDDEIEKEVLKAGALAFLHYPVEPIRVIELLKYKNTIKREYAESF